MTVQGVCFLLTFAERCGISRLVYLMIARPWLSGRRPRLTQTFPAFFVCPSGCCVVLLRSAWQCDDDKGIKEDS